uniref:Adenylate kinase active site lid domain-containing protein n=1 Tax=Bionectria ochroleuca TaxID=29856 RepID=A0A8H7TT08_BIOOC
MAARPAPARHRQLPGRRRRGARRPPPSFEPLLASEDPSASFILDGYPRNATQAHGLESIVPINLAISIVTPFSVILERIAGRWVHEPSGRVYNTTFNTPVSPAATTSPERLSSSDPTTTSMSIATA